MKIAAALIVKDDTEVKQLDRCLKSVAPFVDNVFITGTKKPQVKIKKLCKKYSAQWSWFAWTKDFSEARNYCFSKVPREYDWIFWLDTDDVLVGGENLKVAAQMADEKNIKAIYARYLYSVEQDERGRIKQILIEHLRERLIKNDGTYKWIAPIHETLIEQVPSGKTDVDSFYVVHLATGADRLASLDRNVEILENAIIKDSSDPRPIYYLAKAYFDTRDPLLCYDSVGPGLDSITAELIKDYIRKSGWPEERSQAWEYLAMIHRDKGEMKKAHYALLEAEHEWPRWISIYVQQALTYVMEKQWENAMHYIDIARNMEIPKTTLVTQPRDYKSMILEALFHIYLNTGKLDEAEKVAIGLLELLPNEINKERLEGVMDVKHRNNMAHWIIKLAYHLKNTGQIDKLQSIINAIPKEIEWEPTLINLKNEFIKPTTWGNKSVVIYCGPGFEKWSPKNIAKGIGGSEEAVIYLSKELAKLGWEVTVFGDPQEDEGVYDGVNWIPHYKINWNDNFNIIISWRQIGMFDLPIKSKKSYLWCHDLLNQLEFTPERLAKIDKVFVLSKYHRSGIPNVPDDKVMISSNGLNI
jgi:tetratricopeptide (TPR) repeat protein